MPHLRTSPFHISDAIKSAEGIVNSAIRLLPNLVLGIIVFVIFLMLGAFTKWLIRRAANRHGFAVTRQGLALLLGRLGQLTMVIVGILVFFAITAPSFHVSTIIQMLGIGTVAIGFAFQNILQNFLAGILLLISQPFHLGDFITVTGMEGTVEDIQTRATIITTKEGHTVVIPNATVFMNPVTVRHSSAEGGRPMNPNPQQGGEKRSEEAGRAERQNSDHKEAEKANWSKQVETGTRHSDNDPH